jgi:hypothetical protein
MQSYLPIHTIILLISLLLSASPSFGDETFIYREASEKGNTEIVWTRIEKNGSYFVYEKNDGWSKMLVLEHDTYETRELSYQTDKKEIKAVLRGNIVYLTCRQKGKVIRKEYQLDGLPWIGSVEMGAAAFIKDTTKKQLIFYRIFEENLQMYKMVMIKKGMETIHIDEKTYRSYRIKITAYGLLSLFYSADAWYNEDGIYLKYESRVNPPGIPFTLTELIRHEVVKK